ncbi:multicopper oxidase family protein [Alsobacter sp. R-9]
MTTTRREFLRTAAVGAFALGTLPPFVRSALAQAGPEASPKVLKAVTRIIEVNRKAATVFGLQGADGRSGLTFTEGEAFAVDLRNELAEPTTIHWHGLTPPWTADGVANAPEPLVAAGSSRRYAFPIGSAGTHWMHAHTLQEQNLLAAPLVVRDKNQAARDEQEVVVLLHDFSFTPAAELLSKLKGPTATETMASMNGHGAMSHAMGHAGMSHGASAADINDIEYDAYLANDRTLDDPEVVRVESGGRVRLRVINGATATAFWIDLGAASGEVVAVDGQPVQPFMASRVPLAMGQRVDLVLTVPKDGSALPVLALREGARERTGFILAPPGAKIAKLTATAGAAAPVIGMDFERKLRSAAAGPDAGGVTYTVDLTGTMAGYQWGMNSDKPIIVRQGATVAVTMRNRSMMAHPMHLHGHRFRVVALDGQKVGGAWRDTLLLPAMASATVVVEANNPGRWAFHCHHLYHMAAGMMGTFAYENVG